MFKFFIETKNDNQYKFVDMNVMTLLDFLVPTFENCSKIVIASIHYLLFFLKRGLFEALLEIKSIARK
jgi:hypothetical protein